MASLQTKKILLPSRGFVATLIGITATVLGWLAEMGIFVPVLFPLFYRWPVLPAQFLLLVFEPRYELHDSSFVAVLILLTAFIFSAAFWSAIMYILIVAAGRATPPMRGLTSRWSRRRPAS